MMTCRSNHPVVGTIGYVFCNPSTPGALTAEQTKCVGRALEVPRETVTSEVHVIIEGKLRERG